MKVSVGFVLILLGVALELVFKVYKLGFSPAYFIIGFGMTQINRYF